MIKLINDTIDKNDIDDLIEWLKTNPRLTKDKVTRQFEEKWSKWLGVKHSVYVNSGSSANLAMLYSLLMSNRLKNKKIIIPVICWATTIAPAMQLGFEPIICAVDMKNLCVDYDDLKKLIKQHNPSVLMVVNTLGFSCEFDKIKKLCDDNDVILIEDSCEAMGTTYNKQKLGTFGLMSSFSFYFGHHISTIEGGMISTNDDELYDILLMIRNHGWARDLTIEKQNALKEKYTVDDFNFLYTFYYPGFNIRSTDLQAKIGLRQIDKLDDIIEKRSKNFKLYQKLIKNDFWKPEVQYYEDDIIPSFSYPIIHIKRNDIIKILHENEIECRPLICGSILEQPFFKNIYGQQNILFAKLIHTCGLYVPNNQDITEEEIEKICYLINKVTER